MSITTSDPARSFCAIVKVRNYILVVAIYGFVKLYMPVALDTSWVVIDPLWL